MTQYSGKLIRKTPLTPTQQSASGVWKLNEQAAAIRNNAWPVAGVPDPISRSVRLRSSASAYFNRTPATAGSKKTWTWSGWVKKSKNGSDGTLFGSGTGASTYDICFFNSAFISNNDCFNLYLGNGSYYLVSSAVYRDPSAWYHVVVTVDSTQATASNRLRAWVNGVQLTSFSSSSYPALNADVCSYWNSTTNQTIGAFTGYSGYYYDGYMTEVNFIDGQALTASSFGTTDPLTGAWVPMAYTGTYGTNGFYLNFKDNTSTTTLGYDYSGNANNWTANNISLTAGTTYDSMLDVPTPWIGYNTDGGVSVTRGNYAVVNPLKKSASATITDGNLTVTWGVLGGEQPASFAQSSGKWYWEQTQNGSAAAPGIILDTATPSASSISQGYHYYGNGQFYTGTSGVAYGATFGSGDIIGVALDLDTNQITFYKNGTSQGAKTIAAGSYNPDFAAGTTITINANFGQRPFTYTPPTGYKALCTTNLPDPTIKLGAQYMAASLYTGTSASQSIVNNNNTTSTTFQPDLVWTKARNNASNHAWLDSVRGGSNVLLSDSTGAESSGTYVTSFNSNGFTTAGSSSAINLSTYTYVGWQWKANGAAVSNTDGTITSQVNAGTTQGFSVVTYTGSGSTATVGHGLGVAPKMVIVKRSSGVDSWAVYNANLTSAAYALILNSTAAQQSVPTYWNSTAPTSSVFTISTDSAVNASASTYVAYCFAEVAGYSKFGSYTGNGSADGPFVYCGFRPRYVMVKRTDAAGYGWIVMDSARNTYNVATNALYPDSSSAESTSLFNLDLLSNGFKWRSVQTSENASGGTYIFCAFAENPFKYSNAR